jgi:hypothetical protein
MTSLPRRARTWILLVVVVAWLLLGRPPGGGPIRRDGARPARAVSRARHLAEGQGDGPWWHPAAARTQGPEASGQGDAAGPTRRGGQRRPVPPQEDQSGTVRWRWPGPRPGPAGPDQAARPDARRRGSGARRPGPCQTKIGGHDDLANAAAGALVLAIRQPASLGLDVGVAPTPKTPEEWAELERRERRALRTSDRGWARI